MQTSNFIDNDEQWEINKILNKIESKKNVWYKMKWLNWRFEYNQWLSKKEFNKTIDLIESFE